MSTPHKCPACDGWGKRPSGLYGMEYECSACGGTGVVWETGATVSGGCDIKLCDHVWVYYDYSTAPYRQCCKCWTKEPMPMPLTSYAMNVTGCGWKEVTSWLIHQ